MDYLLHIAILIGIYILLSISLNLIFGFAGVLTIAHAAFFGVGAYVAALMALHWHTPFLFNAACAIAICGTLGAIVAWPSLRIRDDYFVIASFAFQVIAFSVFNNWTSLTGGPMGLSGIPSPCIWGWTVTSGWEFLLLTAVSCLLMFLVALRVVRSPFGQTLKAIREDDIFALATGKNVAAQKVSVFIIGAGGAAVAGVIYAHYIGFVDPTSFTVMESIFIISIVIIGGAGNLWGPVIGSVVLVCVPELLRFVGMPSSVAANVRQILYGVALVGCMMWRPQGLIGEYSFRKNENS